MAARDYRTRIAAASLVIGPLLMAVGDLFHPEESLEAEEQAAIIIEHAGRWYAAHLLLFVGFVLFVPGFLGLTQWVSERHPRTGYWGRIALFAGTFAVSAIFVGEMIAGRLVEDGASEATVAGFLETMFSGPIAAALLPAGLLFFIGIGLLTVPLARDGGEARWPAILVGVGGLLILAEIISAEVLLSQVGNILLFFGSAWFGLLLYRGAPAVQPAALPAAS